MNIHKKMALNPICSNTLQVSFLCALIPVKSIKNSRKSDPVVDGQLLPNDPLAAKHNTKSQIIILPQPATAIIVEILTSVFKPIGQIKDFKLGIWT